MLTEHEAQAPVRSDRPGRYTIPDIGVHTMGAHTALKSRRLYSHAGRAYLVPIPGAATGIGVEMLTRVTDAPPPREVKPA